MHHGRYRKDRLFISDDTFTDPLYRHRNPIIGRTLAFNDLVSAVSYFFIDTVFGFLMHKMTTHFAKITQTDTGNIRIGPCGKFTVSVFPDDKRMHTAVIYP